MGRVRKGKRAGRGMGYLVTWDLDSRDKATTMRLYHFVYGRVDFKEGRVYRREGFASRPGVRYLGQSVLFVTPPVLAEISDFLTKNGIDHEVLAAALM